ncbi:hypothetical protein MKW92_041884 [Papaver armeniacum]|nr:hypothetical protein MKW92_041884 [Papaver armeniacum]
MRNKDRLSKLPNALIQRVLSFLPIKDVVSTSILSKRWRKVWVSTDVFDFRGWWRTYLDKAEGSCEHEMDPDDYLMAAKVFLGFVDRVLSVHDDNGDMPTIQKCYLEIDQILFQRDTVKALVSTIVRRQVEELILDFEYDVTECDYSDDDCDEDEEGIYEYSLKKLYLPHCFFTCESLTRLELNLTYYTALVLPKSFSFPRLKILKLTYVKFNDNDLLQDFFSNCPILEDLSLDTCAWKVEMDAGKLFYCTPKFKILRLSDFIYEGLCFANVLGTSTLAKFNSLTHLVLAQLSYLNIRKLFDLLHNSPNLESLVFDNRICNNTNDDLMTDAVAQCMLLHMKSVEFNNFYGSSSETCKMTIWLWISHLPEDLKNKAMEKLLGFPSL